MVALILEYSSSVTRLGYLGATSTASVLPGFAFGFFVSHWCRRFLQQLGRIWRDLARFRWHFATAVIGYILIVCVFAGFFAFLWQLDHTCLGEPLVKSAKLSDFVFFSLSTVSTLGYVDTKPETPLARLLVSIEVLVGVFWVAVVISRLVTDIEKVDAKAKRSPLRHTNDFNEIGS
jgi:hypothetical protein